MHGRDTRGWLVFSLVASLWIGVVALIVADLVQAKAPNRDSNYSPGRWVVASRYVDSPKACPGYYGTRVWGVAHRTLPCGTRLKLTYRHKVVYTAVVDRGPYVAGRELDLHSPVADALRFEGVGLVKLQVRKRGNRWRH